jgi:hypothetical protein
MPGLSMLLAATANKQRRAAAEWQANVQAERQRQGEEEDGDEHSLELM